MTLFFSLPTQVMSWRAGHKIACPQMQISSPVSGSNKSETTLFESQKGQLV